MCELNKKLFWLSIFFPALWAEILTCPLIACSTQRVNFSYCLLTQNHYQAHKPNMNMMMYFGLFSNTFTPALLILSSRYIVLIISTKQQSYFLKPISQSPGMLKLNKSYVTNKQTDNSRQFKRQDCIYFESQEADTIGQINWRSSAGIWSRSISSIKKSDRLYRR